MRAPRTRSLRPRAPLGRSGEGASATAVSGIIAFAVFALSLTVLLDFAQAPVSTAKPDDTVLRTRATDALRVIAGSTGYPVSWGVSNESIQGLERLGLLQHGKLRTLDPDKFDALAKGRTSVAIADDKVDYPEAKAALGLTDHEFHLRAYPVFQPFPHGSYGVTGMDDWRVAYIGHWSGSTESPQSVNESWALDVLPIAFKNSTNTGSAASGDKFKDTSMDIRKKLVPLLGAVQEVVDVPSNDSSKAPSFQFRRVNATQLTSAGFPAPYAGSYALVVSDASGVINYTKNTDHRAVLGYANLSGISVASVEWYEMVEGEGRNETVSCGSGCTTWERSFVDYGVVEASLDGGATWTVLNPKTTTTNASVPSVYSPGGYAPGNGPSAWVKHTVPINGTNCPGCPGSSEVLIAVRWIAANDNVKGSGWFIDDFVVKSASTGAEVLNLTFESPYYNGLVIGSNVDQNAMTPAELKYAIKDFVLQGGKLYVMGGQQNVQWLQPLFHVGISGTSGQAFAPDETHPLLSIPNQLEHEQYDDGNEAWTFSQHNAHELFSNVVQGDTSADYVLAVNNPNAFGDGQVIITTWLPHKMETEEMRKWFANAVVYGKYHYLYMEVGPNVPGGVPVASATATGVMDKTRDDSGEFIEMALILYVWQ